MTVIRPNGITGITSITALNDTISVYKSDGTTAGLQLDGVNFNTTGVSTVGQLNTTTLTVNSNNYPSAGPLSNRNIIINGAMQVAQRGTQVTGVTASGYKSLDRMRYSENNLINTESTIEQSTDAPDGFSYSLKITVTTAEGSVSAADAFRPIEYRIEGQDLQHLAYGTSSAKSLTLSFYVKSSVTGTYSVAFYRDESTDRLITATYTISSANTWEYKTITIPGDTGTSITNDNANRFAIYFHAGAGSNWTSTDSSGSWGDYASTGLAYGSTVNLQNTLNATWQVTGIQLEVGEVATPFEHRFYGDELARCERYYEVIRGQAEVATGVSNTTTGAISYMRYRTVKRSAPSTVTLAPAGQGAGQMSFLTAALGYPSTTGSNTASILTAEGFRIVGTSYVGLTDDACSMLFTNGEVAVARVDAEL